MGITPTDLQVRTYAPEILTGYGNKKYASRRLLPPITVKNRESQIAEFTADHMRLINTVNSGTDPATQVNDGMSYTNLDLIFHAAAKKMTQSLMDEFPNGVSAVKWAYGIITQAMQIEEEYNLATDMVTSGNYTLSNYGTPTTKFNVSGGDPVKFFNESRATVRDNCGEDPNHLEVSWLLHLTLADIARDSLGGNASYRMPSNNDLAGYYGFETYDVLTAIYDKSVEGQTRDLDGIWGDDNFFMTYLPRKPSAMEPAFGYTVFVKNLINQLKEMGVNPQPWTNFIANMEYQSKVLSYAAAFWGHTCLA